MERRLSSHRLAVGLFALLVVAGIPVRASNDAWSVAGSPPGGNVMKVVVNPATPSVLYATSGPGVFKSADSGSTWKLVFPTPGAPNDLVIDPKDPSILYTGCSGCSGSLYKTTDGGATWNEMDTGIGHTALGIDGVSVLAVDPVNEGVVYALCYNTGAYTSTNGGATWTAIDTGLSATVAAQGNLNSVTVDPKNPQILFLTADVLLNPMAGGSFASDPLTGLYRSVDAGQHWSQILTYTPLSGVLVDPTNDQNVYAAGPGLYVSTDGGSTFTAKSATSEFSLVAMDPSNPQHLWARSLATGLESSTDGGSTWTASSLAASITVDSIATDPVTPTAIYASSIDWGVFKSTDGGTTWQPSDSGIYNVVPNLMFEGSDAVTYLATAGSGIYKSPDQGVTWSEVGGGVTGSLPAAGDFVYALVEDPTKSTTLYAGTTQGIYKTLDGGTSWSLATTGMPTPLTYIFSLAIDPAAPSTVYAGLNTSGSTSMSAVYKSVDGGTTWTAAANGITNNLYGGVQALAVDPHHSNVVYAGAYGTGLFKSSDSGSTWTTDAGSMGATDIWAVAVDPNDSNTVYVSSTKGFYKSTDAGATWVESDSGMYGYIMTNIQIDPADTAILYVTQRYGSGDAYMSPDAGAHWYALSTGLTASAAVKTTRVTRALNTSGHPMLRNNNTITIDSVAINPASPTQILGAGSNGQVFTYTNLNPPTGTGSGSGSGSGGTGSGAGKGGSAGGASGGGGGAFSVIPLLLLLGFAAGRRRR